MKFRTTLIAALVLALLGAYAYFFEYKKAEEKKKEEEKAKIALQVDWEKLEGLTIKNANGTFELEVVPEEKEEEGKKEKETESHERKWRIVSPLKTDADNPAINSMVTTLKNLKVEKVVSESPEDLAPFGLDKPAIEIGLKVSGEAEAPPVLLVGGKSPVGYNSYAMRKGENKVLLLSTHLKTQFEKDLYGFREKRLFGFKQNEIERVRVLHEGKPLFELAREEETWRLVHPFQARASESDVNKILNKLTGLRAESFDDEAPKDLAAYGLDKPTWKVELVLKPEHTRAVLLLGKAHDTDGTQYVYAKREVQPTVVSLKADLVDTFDKKPEDLREKRVFPVKTWKVRKAELAREGQEIVLVKHDGSKWRITAPIDARADSDKVSAFLAALSRLEAQRFLDKPSDQGALADYGLSEPIARVTLYEQPPVPLGKGEDEKEQKFNKIGTFLLGRVGKGDHQRYYATLEGDNTIYAVKADFFEKDFPASVETLRSKRVLDFYRYEVMEVEIQTPKELFLFDRKDGPWTLKTPTTRELKEEDVNALLIALTDLDVDHFAEKAPEDLKPFGLDAPDLSIRLVKEDGKDLGTIFFSAKGPEDQADLVYVKADNDPWIGLLKKEDKKRILEKLAPLTKAPSTEEG